MTEASPALEIHDMTVAYHRKPVLWDIDLTVRAGTLVGVIGPNGAGKSTLIKAVLGLVPVASGWVRVHGDPYRKRRREVGYVPQRESVDWDFPVDVLDVVMMGTYGRLGWVRRPGVAERAVAMAALEQVDMKGLARRQISQLSGGQQQRVFLARALVQDADLYLMDEPFAGVDPIAVADIQDIVRNLRRRGISILLTDHNVRETLAITDRSYIIFEGRILRHGPASELVNDPLVRQVYLGEKCSMPELHEDGDDAAEPPSPLAPMTE